MFTTGNKAFIIFFIVVFAIGLIWSYKKDSAVTKIHFKKSYLVLFGLILFLSLLFVIVKFRKFL